jgi:DNA-binding NtrC family response regulator
MTAFGSVSTAVEAMKNGAFDYVQKPFEIEEMEVKIEKALELKRLRHELDYLRHEQQENYDFDKIIGASDSLQRVLGVVRKVAKSNSTVLIRGETGTGKELIAGAIHHNSLRAGRNFVKVNCAALQENLLESELFGHEKGAFTGADKQRIGRFEQADGGTLFLDEVGDMSANTQAKILRVLRERKDDIGQLATFFLKRFAGELKKRLEGLSPDAQKLLMRYNWPGNIRELENAIERAVLLADGSTLTASDLRLGELSTTQSSGDASPVVKIPPTGIALEEIERQALVEALKMSNWVQKDAAELLSISPRVMNYKIKTLGIDYARGRRPPLPESMAS